MRVTVFSMVVCVGCRGSVAPPSPPASAPSATLGVVASPAPATPPGTSPCTHLLGQCIAAGYVAGGDVVGRGIETNCLDALQYGAAIEGITLDAGDNTCIALSLVQNAGIDGDGPSPCDRMVRACKDAGFYVGGSEHGRGLWFNCMTPLARGDAMIGVSADHALVHACLAGARPSSNRQLGSPFLPSSPPVPSIPGIPNAPDLVTVIPFFTKPNETALEQTKVVVTAEIDGLRGNFVVDLGAPELHLNHTYLQASATGGVEAVTDANRRPERPSDNLVKVKLRLGSFEIDFDGPHRNTRFNAYLDHMWGNFAWVFAPRLGNISLSVIEPFETIIDYPNRRVVLIKLDATGHRLTQVPAYTPRTSVPLLDLKLGSSDPYWGISVTPELRLDLVDRSKNTESRFLDTGAPQNAEHLLGYPFLRSLGAVGLNHRTHELVLYQ